MFFFPAYFVSRASAAALAECGFARMADYHRQLARVCVARVPPVAKTFGDGKLNGSFGQSFIQKCRESRGADV